MSWNALITLNVESRLFDEAFAGEEIKCQLYPINFLWVELYQERASFRRGNLSRRGIYRRESGKGKGERERSKGGALHDQGDRGEREKRDGGKIEYATPHHKNYKIATC